MPWWEQVGGDVDDLIFADEEYEISARCARGRLSKSRSSRKLRREEKCERKPSGCPFAFHNPPQRQNCKIMIQKLILQFWKQLGEKARRDFLTS